MADEQGQEVEVTSEAVETPEENVDRVLIDKLSEKGFEIDAENDDDLLGKFEELLAEREGMPTREEYDRLKGYEPLVSEYQQHATEFQKWKEAQAKSAEETPTDEEDDLPAISPPKIDQAAAQVVHAGLGTGKVTRTSTGLYETTDPAYRPFVDQVNTASLKRREFFQRFEDDPADFIGSFTRREIKALQKKHDEELKAIREEIETQKKSASSAQIQGFFEKNAEMFWVDPSNKKDLTPMGVAYSHGWTMTEGMDLPEAKRHQMALELAEKMGKLATPTEAKNKQGKQSAEEPEVDKKTLFLRKKKPARTTDKPVEHTPSGRDVTAGSQQRRMDWNEVIRATEAEIS